MREEVEPYLDLDVYRLSCYFATLFRELIMTTRWRNSVFRR